MVLLILVRWHLYIESGPGPWCFASVLLFLFGYTQKGQSSSLHVICTILALMKPFSVQHLMIRYNKTSQEIQEISVVCLFKFQYVCILLWILSSLSAYGRIESVPLQNGTQHPHNEMLLGTFQCWTHTTIKAMRFTNINKLRQVLHRSTGWRKVN